MYRYVILMASLAFTTIAVLNFYFNDLKNSAISVLLAIICFIIFKKMENKK